MYSQVISFLVERMAGQLALPLFLLCYFCLCSTFFSPSHSLFHNIYSYFSVSLPTLLFYSISTIIIFFFFSKPSSLPPSTTSLSQRQKVKGGRTGHGGNLLLFFFIFDLDWTWTGRDIWMDFEMIKMRFLGKHFHGDVLEHFGLGDSFKKQSPLPLPRVYTYHRSPFYLHHLFCHYLPPVPPTYL